MPYFTKEQEERAVALILKECNFCENGDNSSDCPRNMSYVERDEEGYVVGLVDLGLQHVPRVIPNEENDDVNNSTKKETTSTKTRHWSMPPSIGYLTRLRKLTVYHCKSLPREVMHLSDSLQEVAFHFCDELDFDALPQEFECLNQLVDFRIHGRTTKAERYLPIHRLQNFSNLRYLYCRGGSLMDLNDEDEDEINVGMLHPVREIPNPNSWLIQDLLSDDIKFKKSLEILEIEGGDVNEFTVADLFLHILPQYPNLKRLILPNNKIRSLAPIIAKQPLVLPLTVRLKCFYLVGNPVLDIASPNEMMRPEQTNLLRLLNFYEDITSLGHGITESAICTTELLLALDLNDGGKILLSERFKSIPLSVWPIVLERVNQRKGYYRSTNVLYHLLRNGPALGKRTETKSSASSTSSTTNMDHLPISAAMHADEMIATVELPQLSQFLLSYPAIITPTTETMITKTRKRKISMP